MKFDFNVLRQQANILLTLGGWVIALSIGLMALTQGGNAVYAACVSTALNLIPTWCTIKRRTDSSARMAIGVIAALQPALMLYAMQGSFWQIDMHLYILVALASLALLCDARPIIAACAIVLVHHALLPLVAPSWGLWGGGGFIRVMIHTTATLIIGSVLCWTNHSLAKMMATAEELRRSSDKQAKAGTPAR